MWLYPAGGRCRHPGRPWPPAAPPLQLGFGAGVTHVNHVRLYTWTVSGLVDPGAGIKRIELRSPAGATPVVLFPGHAF